MLKVTLSDYSVIYVKTIGEALEKAFKLGHTVVLYTTKETIVLNIKHTSLSVINEILNSGTFRHNQIISGRVLKWASYSRKIQNSF